MVADPDELEAGDRRLLAALYRDDDDDEVGADERDRLAGWEGVRGALREARADGFDAEPPSEGPASMAALMAAARAHAPKPKSEGLWARLTGWLMPLVAHPAMAGAAALVVVGGAAGVLYLRGKHKLARPSVVEPARPVEPAPPPSPITNGELGEVLGNRQPSERPGPARGEAQLDGAGSGSATPTTGGSDGVPAGGRKDRGQGEGGEPRWHGKNDGEKPKGAPSSGANQIVFDDGQERNAEEKPPSDPGGDEDSLELGQPAGGTEQGVTVDDTFTEVVSPTSPPPPPPPPPPSPTPKTPVTTTKPAKPPPEAPMTRPGTVVTERADSTNKRADLDRLTAAARTAAAAGDCAKVATLSKQVAALDAAYHRDVFARDPAIARCR